MTGVFRLDFPRCAGVLCSVLLGLALTGCATAPPVVEQPPASRPPGSAVAAPLLPTSRQPDAQPPSEQAADPFAAEDTGAGYGMLYFPSAGQSVQLVTDIALNRLYEDALPGYGLYTFVLLGAGFERASGAAITRHSELFRMIETYVATPSETPETSAAPSAEAHVFVIPIRAGRAPNAPLMDLVAVDLSNLMRRQLGELLRQRGQARVATQIERGAGPFLIAGLEPSLLPLTADAPRLVADLSTLGPEHVYSLVDAYDRDIPPDVSGRPESLAALRQRLLDLAAQLHPAPAKHAPRWIVLI